MNDHHYAGFWIRTAAAVIDSALVLIVIYPILTLIYGQAYWKHTSLVIGGWDLVLNYVLPAIAIIVFWVYKSATPGKIWLRLIIVDAETGLKPSTGQLIVRYLGYYVSLIPLMLGIVWVAFDERKQGWHDKIAGTVVLRKISK